MPSNLNEILKKWEEAFDKVSEDIDSNLDNFKAPILEFGDLGTIYYTLYIHKALFRIMLVQLLSKEKTI